MVLQRIGSITQPRSGHGSPANGAVDGDHTSEPVASISLAPSSNALLQDSQQNHQMGNVSTQLRREAGPRERQALPHFEPIMPGMAQDATPYSSLRQLLREGPARRNAIMHTPRPEEPATARVTSGPGQASVATRFMPGLHLQGTPHTGRLFSVGVGGAASTPYSRHRGTTRYAVTHTSHP